MNDKIQCFTCFKFRETKHFDDNHREYQRPSQKGKLFSCRRCTRARVLRELRAVRYDFTERKFVIYHFKNKNQALKLLKDAQMQKLQTKI